MDDMQLRALKAMERLESLADKGNMGADDLALISQVIQDQHQKIVDLRELKDGYLANMIAWRRYAEDGTPLEQSLKPRSTPASRRVIMH